jgi:EamA-like transporter family.
MLLGQAPVTALLAVPLLGEPLSALQIAGGALVLAGIYVVNRAPAVCEATQREPLME